MNCSHRYFAAIFLFCISAIACEHPVSITSGHVEAMEVLLRDSTGSIISQTVDNARWSDDSGISGTSGTSLRIGVNFIDIHGHEFNLGSRADASVRIESDPEGIATWEHMGEYGYLHLLRTGNARIRFMVWHIDHPDLISPWISLSVTNAGETGL